MSAAVISKMAQSGTTLKARDVQSVVEQVCPAKDYRGKRVLLIIPDGTRTAPVGLLFKTLHRQISEVTAAFDILVGLGKNQPMSEPAICERLEISESERSDAYRNVRFFNHAWNSAPA